MRARSVTERLPVLPQPPPHAKPAHKRHGRSATARQHDAEEEASSARQWELQMEAAAKTVNKLNKKIQGPAYVHLESSATLRLELDRQKLKNRELRKMNKDLENRLHLSEDGRRLDNELDALSDEESDALHLRERRKWRRKMATADAIMRVLRLEVASLRREAKELKVRAAGLEPGPNDMLAQMRELNTQELQVHSARQAKALKLAQLDLQAANEALLHRESRTGADEDDAPEQLRQVRAQLEVEAAKRASLSAQLAESEEQRQRLTREKLDLAQEVERHRSGQASLDAASNLNTLRNRSALQEANVERVRKEFDEYQAAQERREVAEGGGSNPSQQKKTEAQRQRDHYREHAALCSAWHLWCDLFLLADTICACLRTS